jgi:hypothetical protein
VLHVELHRFPHSARAFNLSEQEVRATIAAPWEAGRLIELGERFWAPGECRLTILEGPELAASELGMGRGWTAARRRGRDVTDELIRAPAAADPRTVPAGRPFADFKDEVLGLAVRDAVPLRQIWRLAAARYPERPLSECLGLAERAAAELLHDELVVLLDGDAHEAERTLRAWETWSPPEDPVAAAPRPRVRATPRGARAHTRG